MFKFTRMFNKQDERRKRMNPKIMIRALMLFIMLLPVSALASDLGPLRLSLVEGDVQMRAEDFDEWVPATINMPLRGGDRLWVPEGARAEIQVQNGTAVRLDERTALDILTVEYDSLQLYLDQGQVYLNFRNQGDSVLQMDTPVSSVRVYEPAKFGVLVTERGDTDISVFRGRAYAESRSGRTAVIGGQMLSLGDNYAELSPLGRPDEWEAWNQERDRIFEERGYSSQYLPAELEGYAGDLDNNGRWVFTSSYGYVWTPTVHISLGWAPYSNGRWLWIDGDYVWVDSEPWGWLPYHYGRWTFLASFGWCWVPPERGDVYWGPGYVGWVSTPTYVAWVPLAPGEIYYGYGHYGRHSVNIVNVNVSTIKVENVYKNTHVRNGVIGVPREAFLKGKKEEIKFRDNPFLKDRISIGRPRISPELATRIPVMKDIPKAKEPPARVREIRVNEIKERRHFVRERDRSVFRPESSVKKLPVRSIGEPKKGGAVRAQEPDVLPRTRDFQPTATEQRRKKETGRQENLRQVPVEKQKLPPDRSPGGLPVIEKEKQIRQDGGRMERSKQEIRTPAAKGSSLRSIREPKKGGAVRPQEPDVLPRTRDFQPTATEQRRKKETGRQENLRQVPVEKQKQPPAPSSGGQPLIRKNVGQEQRPGREQERQIRQDGSRMERKQQEIKTPAVKGSPPASDEGLSQDTGKKKETGKKVRKESPQGQKKGGDQDEQQDTEGRDQKNN
jgi:hypothetical protein